MKRLLVSKDRHETRVALLEDGRLAEFYVERAGCQSLVGNIYLGRVENVLAGMDAAFVDIGTGRNGYLSVDEVSNPDAGSAGAGKITHLLRSGREILVQVTRDGMGTKGPRLTTQIGLPGRYVVFMPEATGCGVSRRLDDAERERLRGVGAALRPDKGGLIIRTAAEGAGPEAIERDIRFLQRVWAGVERRIEAMHAPTLVYRESELSLRAVRDLLAPEFDEVIVDDADLHRRLRNFVKAVAPELVECLRVHDGSRSLFDLHGIERGMRDALHRRVELPSGGYLVLDHTEAMTVIDVNTGRYVGKRFLEDTTLRINLEACREIVHQLRLRDIGGIIVIDFIDMASKANRAAVLAALEAELARDRTKTYVVEISPLGLVEMTRQNVTPGLRDVMTGPCPLCGGEGRVLSDTSALIAVERHLEESMRESVTPGLRVEVHPRMHALLTTGSPSRIERLERLTQHFVILVESVDENAPLDHLAMIPD